VFAGSQAFLAVFQAGLLFLEYLELALDLVEFPVQAFAYLPEFLENFTEIITNSF